MTYENICKKLGFDPIKDGYEYHFTGNEDDTQVSPFSVLTIEEHIFLYQYMKKHSVDWYIDQILWHDHTNEEWIKLEKRIKDYLKSAPKDELDLFTYFCAIEKLDTICYSIQLKNRHSAK